MSISIILAAFLGTVAFSILFDIPPKYCGICGLIGAIGWTIYSLVLDYTPIGDVVAIFLATVVVALLSRVMAVKMKTPEIIFLIAGIFPLIPGAGIYWSAYYLVSSQMEEAGRNGSLALRTAFAIVLGIVVVHELPSSLFQRMKKGSFRK